MPQLIEPLVQPLVGQLIFASSGSPAAPPPLADNYIGRWNFNSGVTSDGLRLVDDITPRGTVRTLQPGRCATFNGTTQYLAIAGNVGTGKAHAVVECWINVITATGTYRTILEHTANYAANSSFVWDLKSGTNKLEAALKTTGGYSVVESTAGLSDGWHHVVTRVDLTQVSGANFKMWVDGVAVATTTVLSTGTPLAAFPNLPWYVGGATAGTTNFWNTKLSAPRIIHPASAWSDAACALLYTQRVHYADTHCWLKLDDASSALFLDSSGNDNHGTATNWATGMHYEGADVPYSWQNEVGYSAYTDGVGTNLVASPNVGAAGAEYTKTDNAEYAPSTGTLVAEKYLETTTNAVHVMNQAITVASTNGTTPYIFSVDIKPIGASTHWLLVLFDTGSTKDNRAKFTLTGDGTVGAQTPTTFKAGGTRITKLGGGWYRCEVCAIPDSGNTLLRPSIYGYDVAGSTVSYAGTITNGMYIANQVVKIGSLYTPRDESAPTLDILGNALQYSGQCPLEPPALNSNCLTLNGTNQYVNCGTGTWDTDGTQAMTISGRFKTADTSGVFCANAESAAPAKGWGAWLDSGKLLFQVINSTSGANYLSVDTVATFNDDAWHSFTITYDGSRTAAGVTFSVDGISQAKNTPSSNTLTLTSSTPTSLSLIGSRNAVNLFAGSLCNITVTIGSNTWRYPCSEGPGATQIHNTEADSGHGTLINASAANWTTLQPKYHHNLASGHRTGVNLLTYSEQFDNAAWTKSQTTVTANQIAAPDGTTTADKISDDAALSDHQLYKQQSCTNATVYTQSVYAKYGTLQYITLKDGYSLFGKVFDVQNGTVGGNGGFSAPTTATITDVGSGWYRCVITYTTNTTNIQTSVKIHSGSTGAAYAGGSGYTYLWGAQLEVGSSATTYQRTIANPGTSRTPARNGSTLLSADGLTLTNPPGIYNNAAESTIDFTCGQTLATAWNGKTVPAAHLFGAATTDLRKRSVSAMQEDRYNILK